MDYFRLRFGLHVVEPCAVRGCARCVAGFGCKAQRSIPHIRQNQWESCFGSPSKLCIMETPSIFCRRPRSIFHRYAHLLQAVPDLVGQCEILTCLSSWRISNIKPIAAQRARFAALSRWTILRYLWRTSGKRPRLLKHDLAGLDILVAVGIYSPSQTKA